MDKDKEDYKIIKYIAIAIIVLGVLSKILPSKPQEIYENITTTNSPNTITILSSYENKAVEKDLSNYAKQIGKTLNMKYMGDLDIVEELNKNSKQYDAVWISNSMWLYMLDNSYLTSDSKSISISPVVFGIKKKKAEELGLIDTNVDNNKMVELIKDKKIKYVMSSVTRTNTGATAYLGFLASLAGNPEVLTEEMIQSEELEENLKGLFSGVERVSGEEDYLQEMFLNTDDYEAVIAAESSLIEINKKLEKEKKDPLYLIYPTDGVAINDSTFAFINNDNTKEEAFLKLQSYLLSDKGKEILAKNGVRTWYGGITKQNTQPNFKKKWGIDTTKYLNVTKFPSKKVITSALNIYIEKLRKPTHIVFCLDYSGSMIGEGETELSKSMNYILDYEKAEKDKLQFSEKDKITVIPFSSSVRDVWTIDNGRQTEDLIKKINNEKPNGSTALYAAIIKGLETLEKESEEYTTTIIAMTDGMINVGSFDNLKKKYKKSEKSIPIYSITFGSADERQLEEIAKLSNAKVFDGKTNLLKAFKEVRGYN